VTTPRATYRLQLRAEFGFDDAAALADYLAALGVSHLYASPYLQAAPGSAHGYDVVDHSRVNTELGGPLAHERLTAALGEAGLGQILDIVPNHMAITPENAWWTDVLENGPSSRYAAYFDVDWDPPERKLRNTVLLPVLGDHYGRVLEAGELELAREGGSFVIRYFEHWFPVAPRTYDAVLERVRVDGAVCDEAAFLARAAANLPPAWATDRASVDERHRDKEVLKQHLAALCATSPAVAAAVDDAVAAINADVDALDLLLDRQNYRLAHWRVGGEELDYRRFFDVTSLAGLCMEDGRVFADTHALVLGWLREGVLDGVRIDHPDGLADPLGYLERLRAEAPEAWIVLEKILEPGEELPEAWPADGTTGYDALGRIGNLFVDPDGEAALTEEYVDATGSPSWPDVRLASKQLVVDQVLAADVSRLTNRFVAVCEQERRYRDFSRTELRAVIAETLVSFPVYRTYVRPGVPLTPADEHVIASALADAQERRPDLDPELFTLLGRVLRGRLDAELCERFQQTSGPIMAKGVEDTAFYRYVRLTSLNEVGGDPATFGTAVDRFHAETATSSPASMLASSTHDTKRSEDVRARLALLSEIPREFADAVERWTARHAPPDANLAWAVLQTLIGAHPLPVERAKPYVEKAMREAKERTSWLAPDTTFEADVFAWLDDLYADATFQAELDAFVAPLLDPGWANALGMQLVKLTVPGVPDLYQGTELWDLSLVDPDNRRPVDFELRRRMLAELDAMTPADAWERRAEGYPKLLVTRDALLARPSGPYRPLAVRGAAAAHVVAFTRDERVSTVATRLPLRLAREGGWRDTCVELPGRGEVAVAELLADLPVALVVR
jgi:(1->4)-alpha-D-glucan 1-alpha-D-glucosylmutase